MNRPRRRPAHAGGLKFELGQAVLILDAPPARSGTLTTVPGVVCGYGDCYLTVQTSDRKRRVSPIELAHQGHCPCCMRAAHQGIGRLVCPWCGGDASAPVPDALRPAWADTYEQWHAWLLHTMLDSGCSWRQAWVIANARQRAA